MSETTRFNWSKIGLSFIAPWYHRDARDGWVDAALLRTPGRR
jgi:hypothetical protein